MDIDAAFIPCYGDGPGSSSRLGTETTDPVVPAGDETAAGSQETVPAIPATEATETDTAEETPPEAEVPEEPETVEETEPEVVEETETVEAPEPEVVEGTDPEVAVTEDFEPEAEVDENPVTATDNRSPNGQFHGGHRGSVSTLARAGLGQVFGNLRSQGYGDIQIEQIGDEITLEAFTGDGQIRKLTYDATTGALLSDEQGQPNLIQSIANTFRKDRAGPVKTDKTSKSARSGNSKQVSGSNVRGGGFGGSKNNSTGAKSDSNGKGNGGQGGGNGKGNGGGQGGDNGKGNGGGQGSGNDKGNGGGQGGGRNK